MEINELQRLMAAGTQHSFRTTAGVARGFYGHVESVGAPANRYAVSLRNAHGDRCVMDARYMTSDAPAAATLAPVKPSRPVKLSPTMVRELSAMALDADHRIPVSTCVALMARGMVELIPAAERTDAVDAYEWATHRITLSGWEWLSVNAGITRPADAGRATLAEALDAVEWAGGGNGIETAELSACLKSWARYGTVPSPAHSDYALVALMRGLISRIPRAGYGLTRAGYRAAGLDAARLSLADALAEAYPADAPSIPNGASVVRRIDRDHTGGWTSYAVEHCPGVGAFAGLLRPVDVRANVDATRFGPVRNRRR